MTDLVRNYGDWFSIKYAITYFYNVYGPRESSSSYGTVVAIFRNQYLQGSSRTVVSPGTQERIFTHVDDIVAGLVAVGERGEGDGYGIGGDDKLTVLDLARLFGPDILLLPERQGNRQVAAIDTSKTRELGWSAKRSLTAYVGEFIQTATPAPRVQNRVLVFATTFYPISGPAEDALLELARTLPDLHFDIITAAHAKSAASTASPLANLSIYRVGSGSRFDKYLLPILGRRVAFDLAEKHSYLFAWSLMASYGTLPALALRRAKRIPLLITLADQVLSWRQRLFLRFVMSGSDQVYASMPEQARKLASLDDRMRNRTSLGSGDAFANQIRFAYSNILRKKISKEHSRLPV